MPLRAGALPRHRASLFRVACRCRGCQLMSASAFSLSSCYLAERFALIAREPVIGGLHGATRHYRCPHCLSWLFTRPEGLDHIVNIRTMMLDVPPLQPPLIETCMSTALLWARTGAPHSFAQFPPMPACEALIADYSKLTGAI